MSQSSKDKKKKILSNCNKIKATNKTQIVVVLVY